MTDVPLPSGPPVARLTRRLLDTPPDFLAEPGVVTVAAVVSDLFVGWGAAPLDEAQAELFRPPEHPVGRNWLRCVLITTWVLADPWFATAGPGGTPPVAAAWLLLTRGERDLTALAAVVPSASLVTDEDRREELARRVLAALGLVPEGETAAGAADRLGTLDSVERVRVIAATREAEERAAAVRKAMHEKAAAEAAAKVSRE